MKISIHDHTTIADVQQQFSERFPYLKLEFFSKRHRPGNGTHLKFLLPHDQRLGDIRKTHNEGEIDIYPDMRVSELEQLFGTHYDLGVQVFRKSGKTWLETILTDSWTLREQNKEGEFLSTRIQPEPPNYDLDIE
ncbi:MAG: hypothetical protein A3D31_12685 [Candidatus Fluviicola riflensis]|nr:MAG: hypothetical protein CHH17_17125 [Candidatus Fluviicola riflensis]OGS77840.1 MAG: hypothetical protein A3D31_12685 [Candidatus Fluviicola riflensis]OGS84905.1 MAG: hypothetical protein A2724_09620 [Fluviicola sp. RIFCSPHIGHO2_01_FULL_43_53]OGS89177.1 MAG: hypothetical protein A3E30_03925 [Fluviicola sp. RIFCSPHIGHO2_12_FULL_43_24]